jgi:hypothetical protein
VGEDGHGRQIRKMRRPRLRGAAGELKLRRPREDVYSSSKREVRSSGGSECPSFHRLQWAQVTSSSNLRGLARHIYDTRQAQNRKAKRVMLRLRRSY